MSSRELLQSLKIRSLFFIQLISDLYSSLCSSSSSILSQYREESNKPNALSVFGEENSVEAWVRALVQPWIQSFGLSLDTIKTWREKRVQSCIRFQTDEARIVMLSILLKPISGAGVPGEQWLKWGT